MRYHHPPYRSQQSNNSFVFSFLIALCAVIFWPIAIPVAIIYTFISSNLTTFWNVVGGLVLALIAIASPIVCFASLVSSNVRDAFFADGETSDYIGYVVCWIVTVAEIVISAILIRSQYIQNRKRKELANTLPYIGLEVKYIHFTKLGKATFELLHEKDETEKNQKKRLYTWKCNSLDNENNIIATAITEDSNTGHIESITIHKDKLKEEIDTANDL